MRSTRLPRPPSDDRSTKAQIRDAAIECVAEHGSGGLTARKVASAAGVSTGLVIHHFGSMDALRGECDKHVAATIRRVKTEQVQAGVGLDPIASIRGAHFGPLMKYLAQVLGDDQPAVNALVDDLVADAEAYLQQGVEAGIVQPTGEPRGRAAVLVLHSLGALALHRHIERILGIDLTAPDFGADPTVVVHYSATVLELYGGGLLAEEYTAGLRASLAAAESAGHPDAAPSPGPPGDDQLPDPPAAAPSPGPPGDDQLPDPPAGATA